MQLFELVSPRLFRPLAGPNRAFYAELLLLVYGYDDETGDDRFNEYGIPYGDDFASDPIYLADREVSV